MTHHLCHYGQVVGVDNNPRPLVVARQRGLEAYQGTAEDLPFRDEGFDLVALLDTVEHVPAEVQVFRECWRVLRSPDPATGRPGGKLLVTVPAFMFLWRHNDVINMHQRRYTVSELRTKLAQYGFKTLRISYNNFFIFPLAAMVILVRRGRAKPKLASPNFDEDAYQVEMEPVSPWLNTLLTTVGQLEVALLRHVDLSFGTSGDGSFFGGNRFTLFQGLENYFRLADTFWCCKARKLAQKTPFPACFKAAQAPEFFRVCESVNLL
jgi:SAM-dependent methyltransferase